MRRSTSTDLRYMVGTRGIWFLFFTHEGKMVIHRHPQELLALSNSWLWARS